MTEELKGQKLSDLLFVIYHNQNILPELLPRFEHTETEKVSLPRDTLIRTKNNSALFSFQVV